MLWLRNCWTCAGMNYYSWHMESLWRHFGPLCWHKELCNVMMHQNQPQPRGPQGDILNVKRLRWFAQATICKPAIFKHLSNQRIWTCQLGGILFKLGGRTICLPEKGVSKSFPPCIPKLPKISLLAPPVKEEYSATQICVGLCFRRVVTQRGRLPSLIFCLEISTCSRCKKGLVFAAGEMPS